ncbi:MAG TPA: hypothetical protein VHK91_00650 [Flavisolibacter sp.]|jgi:hypothetical protein|nr:hypothetical protein [Flavisolibacter sp.]
MGVKTFYFQIHHSYTLRNYSISDIEVRHQYFDEEATGKRVKAFSQQSVLPLLTLIREIASWKQQVRFVIDLSGSCLELFEKYSLEVINEMKSLVADGAIRFSCNSISQMEKYGYPAKDLEWLRYEHEAQLTRIFGRESFIPHAHSLPKYFVTFIDIRPFRKPAQFESLNKYIRVLAGLEMTFAPELVDDLQRKDAQVSLVKLRLIRKSKSLEPFIRMSENREYIRDWQKLQDILFNEFEQLSAAEEQSIINIMADLEILLIRKHLDKRFHYKLTQKHLSILL